MIVAFGLDQLGGEMVKKLLANAARSVILWSHYAPRSDEPIDNRGDLAVAETITFIRITGHRSAHKIRYFDSPPMRNLHRVENARRKQRGRRV
jgi:hypothetical protein